MTPQRIGVIAAIVIAAVAATIVVVRDGEDTPRAGPLEVKPSRVRFEPGQDQTSIALHNTGQSSAGFEIRARASWLAAEPATGVVPRGAGVTVGLRANRTGLAAGTYETAVEVVTVDGSAAIPATLVVDTGVAASGPAQLRAAPSLTFAPSATSADLLLSNLGGDPLRWDATPADPFVVLEQRSGAIPGGGSRSVRVVVDRSGLREGSTSSSIRVRSDGGDATVEVRIESSMIPLLVVPRPRVDFGSARGGTATRRLELRNGGLAPLRYQVSVARAWLRVTGGASGAIAPGERAQVELLYEFAEAPFGVDEQRLTITSNGGDAVVQVRGVRDEFAPDAKDRRMGDARERCPGGDCALYRRASAVVTDDTDIVDVQVRYTVCLGTPQNEVSCDEFRFVPMSRADGDTFVAEVGPLPSCSDGLRRYIAWQIYTEDSLGNKRLLPGTKTPEIKTHCRAGGSLG